MIFSKNLKWPKGGPAEKLIHEEKKNLKSKISCQTPVNVQNPEQYFFKPGKETGPGSLVVNLSSTPTGVQTIPIPVLGMLMTVCLWWFTVIPFGGRTATAKHLTFNKRKLLQYVSMTSSQLLQQPPPLHGRPHQKLQHQLPVPITGKSLKDTAIFSLRNL